MVNRFDFTLILIFSVLASIALLASATATTIISLPLAEKFSLASQVIEGKCIATSSAWTIGKTAIMTRITMDVLETFKKGVAQKNGTGKMEFSIQGGNVDDITQLVIGSPQIEKGDHFFLFLTDAGEPLGLGDGVYEVQRVEGKDVVRQKGEEFGGTEIAGQDSAAVESFRRVLRGMKSGN